MTTDLITHEINANEASSMKASGTESSSPTTRDENAEQSWCVYMIRASDQRLYTGITNNMSKRWHAHTQTKQGAKFFRGRQPEQLMFVEQGHDRSSASRREYAIKQLTRVQKLQLIAAQATDWHQHFSLPAADQ